MLEGVDGLLRDKTLLQRETCRRSKDRWSQLNFQNLVAVTALLTWAGCRGSLGIL
jgi:hypothetical protein